MQKKTFTLCIIDDMKQVTESMARQIPWAELDIEVIGTASNGEEGLELIRKHKPDLILTDIRMPRLNGLEMTREALKLLPRSKVIIMSAFSDFEHAQEAIRLGAFDYLTKPITPKELVGIMTKARLALEEQKEQEQKVHLLEKQVRESMPVLRQEFLNLLIRYAANEDYAKRQLEFLGIPLQGHRQLIIAVAELDQFAEQYGTKPISEIELIRFAAHNVLSETISASGEGIVFRDSGTNRFVLMLHPQGGPEEDLNVAERCREHIQTYTKQTISIGLSQRVQRLREVPFAYRQAMDALSYNFYTGGNSVFRYEEMPKLDYGGLTFLPEKELELGYSIRSGNTAKCAELLDDILSELSASPVRPEPAIAFSIYMELAHTITRALQEKLTPEEFAPLEDSIRSLRTEENPHIKSLHEQVKDYAISGCKRIIRDREHESGSLIHQSLTYIREHLHEGLTIVECAKQAHLSSSYYTNVFKKVTGLTFNQFLTHERMEKAKQLLLGEMAVQDVSVAVGYEDRPYFTSLFKKHTGMTPSEFRNTYTGN